MHPYVFNISLSNLNVMWQKYILNSFKSWVSLINSPIRHSTTCIITELSSRLYCRILKSYCPSSPHAFRKLCRTNIPYEKNKRRGKKVIYYPCLLSEFKIFNLMTISFAMNLYFFKLLDWKSSKMNVWLLVKNNSVFM